MQLFDFFSGIGGFSLAGEWMGWEIKSHCEIDPFCQQVLKKHWPDVLLHDNIKTYTNETYEMARGNATGPTIFAGGFPCQPFSTAGKRKGTADDRDLWPDYFNTIQENKPTYVVGENVTGLTSMENGAVLDRIYTDLESEGYQVESFLIPACSVEAWHRRERLWIVAYTNCNGKKWNQSKNGNRGGFVESCKIISKWNNTDTPCTNTTSIRLQRQRSQRQQEPDSHGKEAISMCNSSNSRIWTAQSGMGGMVDGVPPELDGYWDQEPEGIERVNLENNNRKNRLQSLGNSIVPQVAFEIFKAIQIHHEKNTK